MKRINIHEAKTHLSRHLASLQPGEVIVICRNNEPAAELRAIPRPEKRRRPWGVDRGVFKVPSELNEPLADSALAAWER